MSTDQTQMGIASHKGREGRRGTLQPGPTPDGQPMTNDWSNLRCRIYDLRVTPLTQGVHADKQGDRIGSEPRRGRKNLVGRVRSRLDTFAGEEDSWSRIKEKILTCQSD